MEQRHECVRDAARWPQNARRADLDEQRRGDMRQDRRIRTRAKRATAEGKASQAEPYLTDELQVGGGGGLLFVVAIVVVSILLRPHVLNVAHLLDQLM
jgi:hypothetical protein